MHRVRFVVIALLALMAVGCSSLPGLRVLTGQDDQQAIANRTVESLDLVMADKSGTTSPALIAAADRIEAAALNSVDIIEIRSDLDTRVMRVDMLFRPPQVDTSTVEGQAAQLESLRRAVELTWQGTMRESEGSDVLEVVILAPANVVTLDKGEGFLGAVAYDIQIERSAAASYLGGERSLNTFYDLIVQGTLSIESPQEFVLYEGEPNHPMFMLGTAAE
jgi:uncharacterized protein YcfL